MGSCSLVSSPSLDRGFYGGAEFYWWPFCSVYFFS